MWYAIISGLGIGLFGSFHCIGMCGPIALSLPIYGKHVIDKLLIIVLYNLGRASTYATLGFLFGSIGQQFFLFGYQQTFSILIGISMLLLLFGGNFFKGRIKLIDHIHFKIKSLLATRLQSAQHPFSYFLTGMANGLLPCGLVYIAIGSAMATGSAWAGALLMFLFGLGTFPLMISLMIFGAYISISFRTSMRKAVPFFICFTAVIMILRGMGLGIPYLSPQLKVDNRNIQQVRCHK